MQKTDKDPLNTIDRFSIPPTPHILKQLHQELQKDEPNLSDISDIISQDVGMSGLVLKTINSPYFGMRTKIQSIQHATNLLGINYTVSIIAGLSLKRSFEESDADNPQNYWESPTNVAKASVAIGRRLNFEDLSEMYMLGLFHNAGHALLLQHHPNYQQIFADYINHEHDCITDIENQNYNTDHAVLSYYLARSWGLNHDISVIIRDHHSVKELFLSIKNENCKKGKMLAILKMAEHIDKLFWGMKPDFEWRKNSDLILDYLGISQPDYTDIKEDTLEKLVSG